MGLTGEFWPITASHRCNRRLAVTETEAVQLTASWTE
jgi:hypothetical protein